MNNELFKAIQNDLDEGKIIYMFVPRDLSKALGLGLLDSRESVIRYDMQFIRLWSIVDYADQFVGISYRNNGETVPVPLRFERSSYFVQERITRPY